MRSILSAVVLAGFALVSALKSDKPLGCSGVRNDNPVLELPPQPLKTVANGQSWVMQEGNNVVYIAKVSGSPY
jgi:hypothetical protein